MTETDRDALAAAVHRLHGGKPRWVVTVSVLEEHEGAVVWEGEVQVFALEGHHEAAVCYAWEEPPEEEGGKPRVFAVLHVPPVASAADAVRASIVARHR